MQILKKREIATSPCDLDRDKYYKTFTGHLKHIFYGKYTYILMSWGTKNYESFRHNILNKHKSSSSI